MAKKAAQDDIARKMLADAERARKQDRIDKVDILQKQMLRKADDLKNKITILKLVEDM